MRIAWVAYDRKDYTGGPIINTLRLLPEFKKSGHEVLLIAEYNYDHPNVDKLKELGIECHAISRIASSEYMVREMLQAVHDFRPDIFVSNISTAAAFAGKWIQQWGIPVVHTHRSDDALNNGNAEFFFAGSPVWRLSALVCVNRYLFEKIQRLTKTQIRHRIIPSGVPMSDVIADQDNTEKFRVVYAGRIVQKQKRILDVTQAFISLAKTLSTAEFTIIGEGDEQLLQEIKTTIRDAGLEHRFCFTGRLLGEDYKKELARHHVIVLLSDYEGIPGSLMDGMSCGLVPVALEMNGLDDLVRCNENGLIVKDREEDFVNALVRLHKDEAYRKRLSVNALETIKKRFSLDFAVDQWTDLFEDLVLSVRNTKPRTIKIPKRITLPPKHHLLREHWVKPNLNEKIKFRLKALLRAIR